MRVVLSLLFLTISIFQRSLGSLSLTVEQIEDSSRGPEFAIALSEKLKSGIPLSESEIVFAGFEIVRGTHNTIKQYRDMLSDPAVADAEENKELVKPLTTYTEALIAGIPGTYPAVQVAERAGRDANSEDEHVDSEDEHVDSEIDDAVLLAGQKMFALADEDVQCIQTLFTPGAITSLYAAVPDHVANIAMSQLHGATLMLASMMTQNLAYMTRNADRILPMQDAVLAAAAVARAEIKAIIGSTEPTQPTYDLIDKAVSSCSDFRERLVEYKASGVWTKSNDPPRPPVFT